MFNLSTFAVILVLHVGSAALHAEPNALLIPDAEPNNTIQTAIATGIVDTGVALVSVGRIGDLMVVHPSSLNEPYGDIDVYSVEVTGDASRPILLAASVTLDGTDVDAYIRVFLQSYCDCCDCFAVQIAANDDEAYGDQDATAYAYLFEPGSYYVSVSKLRRRFDPRVDILDADPGHIVISGGAPYSLRIELSPAPHVVSPYEPNDGPPDVPTPIPSFPFVANNEFIGDGSHHRLDVDRYGLDVDEPSKLFVAVTPAGLGALNPIVVVDVGGAKFDAVEDPLRSDQRRGTLELAVLEVSTIEITVKGSETAPHEPDFDHDEEYGSTGFYDLFVHVLPVSDAGGPYEPNDSINQAAATGLSGFGEVCVSAHVGDGLFGQLRGDVDFFAFDLAADQGFEFDLAVADGNAPLIPSVHLYNYLGYSLRSWLPNSSGAIHGAFQRLCADALVSPAGPAETYYLAVSGGGDRLPADPLFPNPGSAQTPHSATLALHEIDGGPGSTGSYDLEMKITASPLARCGDEPDDTIFDAPIVLHGQGTYVCTSGMLPDSYCLFGAGGDADLVGISVDEASALLLVQSAGVHCGAAYPKFLRIFDVLGNELANSDEPHRGSGVTDATLEYAINQPGDYFVGVSLYGNIDYDARLPCSGNEADFPCSTCIDGCYPCDSYELHLELRSTASGVAADLSGPAGFPTDPGRLFATRLDMTTDTIIEIDPSDGAVIRSLPAPESPLDGTEGLAFDGTDLFVLGRTGRFPNLYRLDIATGQVLDRITTWFGSGVYGGMAALNGNLYIVDILERAIFVIPTLLDGHVTQLAPGLNGSFSLWGSIGASAHPNRLLVADADDPALIHELDAVTGLQVAASVVRTPCTCDADLDGDGDVDQDDADILDQCDFISGITVGCAASDLNCDGDINSDDIVILECQRAGPGRPPPGNCCEQGLPPLPVRATALAGTGPNRVFGKDWTVPELVEFQGNGEATAIVTVSIGIGQLAGFPFASFGDWDGDRDADLIDWRFFQICFGSASGGIVAPGCEVFDLDRDRDVDLTDYDALSVLFAGEQP